MDIASDILADNTFSGKNIVIWGGGSVGYETADYLAPLVYDKYPRDRNITILEMIKDIMPTESWPGRSLLVQQLMNKGVQMICDVKVETVEEDKIYYSIIDDADHIGNIKDAIYAGYKTAKSL